MKKSVKIVSILLMLVMMVSVMSINTFAANANDVIASAEKNSDSTANNKITEVGGKIMDIVSTVGIIAAVIILMIVGIKYMMGSASEKAEYKKVMIPYIIGAVILFGASGVVKALSGWKIL